MEAPFLYSALQSAKLTVGEGAWMSLPELIKDRLGRDVRPSAQFLVDLVIDVLERVFPGPPGMFDEVVPAFSFPRPVVPVFS